MKLCLVTDRRRLCGEHAPFQAVRQRLVEQTRQAVDRGVDLIQIRERDLDPRQLAILVDEIVCNDSRLVIDTANPDKDPKIFELEHIVLHDVGPNNPWPYDAKLTNAVPKGEIHAAGTFGPWNTESPGDSTVTGLRVRDTATGAETTLDVTGVFVAIGHEPRSALVRDAVDVDAEGYVLVQGRTTSTSLRSTSPGGPSRA